MSTFVEISANKTYVSTVNNVAVTIGNDKVLSEFQANAKMRIWDEDEICFDLSGVKGTPVFANDKISLELTDKKYEWFNEGNELKCLITLKSKPLTNKYSFNLGGDWKDFDFCYQTPFDNPTKYMVGDEEWLKVTEVFGESRRPQKVDGSYAVYHKTKKNHAEGGKNYMIGKACHIYVPKAIDDEDNSAWCTLHIENGVYTVTIPQDFLDTAVYPVIINDTFGYDTQGGTEAQGGANHQKANGPFSPTSDGGATTIHAYIRGDGASRSITLGFWNDNSSVPDTLVEDSDAITIDTSAGWEQEDLHNSPVAILSANDYWLGMNQNGTVQWYYDTDSFTEDVYNDNETYSVGNLATFGSPPNLNAENRRQSIYITYTPSGAGDLDVSVDDDITLTENVNLEISPLKAEVDDDITLTEDVEVHVTPLKSEVNDTLNLSEDVAVHITPLEVSVYDSITLSEDITVETKEGILDVDVNDTLTLSDETTVQVTPLEVSVSDDITLSEDVTPEIISSILSVNVYDSIALTDQVICRRGSWIGILSTHLDSFCGDDGINFLDNALDGLDIWIHNTDETHWFIIDLKAVYNVYQVRGRSNFGGADPTDVNIYVSNNKSDFGSTVASGISTWQDRNDWDGNAIIDCTPKEGRYIKVEIVDTEDIDDNVAFGHNTSPYQIFDVFGFLIGCGINVSDNITLTENVNVFRSEITRLINVFDTLTLSDFCNIEITPLLVNVFDSLTLSEHVEMFRNFLCEVSDNLTLSDACQLEILSFLTNPVSPAVEQFPEFHGDIKAWNREIARYIEKHLKAHKQDIDTLFTKV